MFSKNPSFGAISILVGATIGAGFLAIPYLASKSGFIITASYIISLGLIMLLINLYLAEVVERTKGEHQLSGYAEKYLGKTGKHLMLFSLIFGIFSALLAYAIGVGNSISFILYKNIDATFSMGLIFILIMLFLVFFSFKTFKEVETIGLILMMILFVAITIIYIPEVDIKNLSTINYKFAFLPFGTVLFAMLAFTAIPEMARAMKTQKQKLKKAAIYGTIIPIICYLIFCLVIVGFKGENVPEIATLSLGKMFIILGVISMATSFLALAVIMKQVFRYDYQIGKNYSWLIVSLITLAIYFFSFKFNFASFTEILNVSGTISGVLSAILILLMTAKAKKQGDIKPKFSIKINLLIILIISSIFLIGGIANLIIG